MIIGFAGTPGSGKSYEAVKKIVDNLRMGRVVFTNIDGMFDPECLEALKSVCDLSDLALQIQFHKIENEQLEEFWLHVQPGSLIVLDEVQKVFSSREWQTEKNKQFASWASTHRHQGFDLVLISQQMERIDAAVRGLLEWTYVFRKVNFFGGAVQRKYICYSYAGGDDEGQPLAKNIRTYNPLIFLCYQSYTGKDVRELGIMKHVNVLKHPVFFAIPIVLVWTLWSFSHSSFATGDLFGVNKARQQEQVTAPAKKAKASAKSSSNPESAQEQQPSKRKAKPRLVVVNGVSIYSNRQHGAEK